MTKTMPEQVDGSKSAEHEPRSAEKTDATQPSVAGAAPRGPKEKEPGELDEDALEKVSGGRISAY